MAVVEGRSGAGHAWDAAEGLGRGGSMGGICWWHMSELLGRDEGGGDRRR